MTSHGLCWNCSKVTSRYDTDERRWACVACWQQLLSWEQQRVEVERDMRTSFRRNVKLRPEPVRRPGESVQAFDRRRRDEEAQEE